MFAKTSVFDYFCITIANPNVIMKTLLSILFLFFATYGYSQSEKLFTVDRELSNSNINQIYQAKDGVIWIATEDGLNRYDGAKFSVYKHKEGNDGAVEI